MLGVCMKKFFLIIISLMVTPTEVFAEYHYDWKTGNSYNTYSNPGGGTHVQGFNSRTGSSWNTTIQPNGNMNGFDSKGNYWNYDKNTGSYFNSDGTYCFGKGQSRTCN